MPPIDPLAIYINSQAPIITTAYCLEASNDLWIFSLVSSPIIDEPVEGSGGDLGLMIWRTYYFNTYDWIQDGLDPVKAAELEALGAEAAFLIGDLIGSCDTAPAIALYFSIDDGSGRLHYLLPLVTATPFVYETAVTAAPAMFGRTHSEDPCGSEDPYFCSNEYRGRLKDALDDMVQCMSSSVQPISIWNVACFLGCAPLLTGTPLLYAACAVACNSIVSGAGVINYITCKNELAAAEDDALQSYCSCLQFKLDNCPDSAETDIHGCP